MPTIKLKALLKRYKLHTIDYCSIDSEGRELEILKSIDFNNIFIDIFSIENNYSNNEIEIFMKEKNYKLIAELGIKNKALNQIYKKATTNY